MPKTRPPGPVLYQGSVANFILKTIPVLADSDGHTVLVQIGNETVLLPYNEPNISTKVVRPAFRENTVWADKTGHLWLVQYEPTDNENSGLMFYSSLGTCTEEEAMEYGPFTQVEMAVKH